MKRLLVLVGLALLFLVPSARAQSVDDQYVRIYNLIQEADALNDRNPSGALTKYLEAQTALSKLQKSYPEWKANVVNFRLSYLNAKISAISPKVPAAERPNVKPSAGPTTAPAVPKANSAELEKQTTSLHEEVTRLQNEKAILEAKLKEALATQPASVDSREMVKAAERIKTLLNDNQALTQRLAEEKAKPAGADPKAFEDTKLALAEANKKLAEQNETTKTLTQEKQALQDQVKSLSASAPNVAVLAATKKSLEEANRKLAEQSDASKRLVAENSALQAQVRTLMASSEAAEALRAENQLLKKQLAESKTATPVVGDGSRQLAQAQAQIAALQSDAEILRLEKIALQNRLRQSLAAPVGTTVLPVASKSEDVERIRKLEVERDDLQKKLEAANKEIYGKNSKEVAAKIEGLSSEIQTLRARLGVLEARAVPYTAEEMAFFRSDNFSLQIAVTPPNAGKKPVSELPDGSQKLVAEAQKDFSSRDFAKAEQKYLEVLKRDDKNANTLANLAAIQLQMNHLDDAEKNAKQALTVAPDDAYSLSIFGYIKYLKENYDEALDSLSRAARLSPQNPEIQNYLGLTLSHKGMRGPAETAYRKAIQIDPGFGAAHNNLAVIYLTQKPPLVELARWHYQKAQAAGIPKNADLDKMFEEKSATAGK